MNFYCSGDSKLCLFIAVKVKQCGIFSKPKHGVPLKCSLCLLLVFQGPPGEQGPRGMRGEKGDRVGYDHKHLASASQSCHSSEIVIFSSQQLIQWRLNEPHKAYWCLLTSHLV